MNELSEDKRTLVLYMLGNGEGIRQIERVTHVHRNTIMSLRDSTIEKQDRKQGRPPLGEKAKSSIVPIRVTEAEHAAYLHAARNCKSLSEWIRRTLRRAVRERLNEKANHETELSLQV